jgi:defect-in-organelle-trafficking protein DotC
VKIFKRNALFVATVILSAIISPSLSFADITSDAKAPPTLDDVLKFSTALPNIDASKINAIKEAGMRSGAQAGMMSRARELVAKINERSIDLDKIFSFQPLINKDGFLPPVILSTSQKVETLDGAQRIEFAGLTYKIVSPARFVRVAPTWRDYVFAGIADKRLSVDPLPAAIRPITPDEKKAWEDSVHEGWDVGCKQADAIFEENMAKMKRDYLGMLKYISLRDKGMIKAPVLSKTSDEIKVTKDEISIGVGVKEIQNRAEMESDVGAWGEVK